MSRIVLNTGFEIFSEAEIISLEQARRYIFEHEKELSYVVNCGSHIEMHRDYFICPCCGLASPAYKTIIVPYKYRYVSQKDNIKEFLYPQQLSFGDNNKKILHLNEAYTPSDGMAYCPNCSEKIELGFPMYDAMLSINEEKKTIIVELLNVFESDIYGELILDVPEYTLPFKEKICFDIRKGRIDMELSDKYGEHLFIGKLEEKQLKNSFVFELLTQSASFRHHLDIGFEELLEGHIVHNTPCCNRYYLYTKYGRIENEFLFSLGEEIQSGEEFENYHNIPDSQIDCFTIIRLINVNMCKGVEERLNLKFIDYDAAQTGQIQYFVVISSKGSYKAVIQVGVGRRIEAIYRNRSNSIKPCCRAIDVSLYKWRLINSIKKQHWQRPILFEDIL